MKKAVSFAGAVLCFLALGALAPAQFKSEEIAQREQWEQFLLTAEIVKAERLGEGVTKPWRLYLKKGDTEHTAAWKNPSGKTDGIGDSWKYEIAAYRLDKLLDLNAVPVTVEREFKGKAGCLSLWAENRTSLLKMEEAGESIPEAATVKTDEMKYIIRLWDCLIANDDRTQQNILFTDDWRTILIDHSRAFQSDRKYTRQLVFGTDGLYTLDDGRPILFRRVPRRLVEKITGLTADAVKQAVGPYLTDKEIQAVVARIPLITKEIDTLIKQFGESNVLY
jgi:hypothetical protein